MLNSIQQRDKYQIEKLLTEVEDRNKVWKVKDVVTNEVFALKETDLIDPQKENILQYYSDQEFRLMEELDHPQIVKAFEHGIWDKQGVENISVMYTVLEYVGNGDLYSMLKKHGRLSERVVRLYGFQMAGILRYLHGKNIVHRDLKPENILIDNTFNLKLCDFNIARKLGEKETLISSPAGTPTYYAPEMALQPLAQHCPYASEMFTFGLILYNMLTATHPYSTSASLHDPLYKELYTYPEEYWKKRRREFDLLDNPLTDDFVSLMNSLLEVNPKRRASLDEALDEPWFEGEVPGQHDLGLEMHNMSLHD